MGLKAIPVVAIVVLWIGSLYILVTKDTFGTQFGTPHKLPAYPLTARRFALAGLLLIPTIALASIFAWANYQSLPSDKIIIAVAEFQGPDTESHRVTELLLAQLRRATKEYPEVMILPLHRTISEQEGNAAAQEEGRQVKASAVIWGWYGKTEERVVVTSHLEILRQLKHSFPLDTDWAAAGLVDTPLR